MIRIFYVKENGAWTTLDDELEVVASEQSDRYAIAEVEELRYDCNFINGEWVKRVDPNSPPIEDVEVEPPIIDIEETLGEILEEIIMLKEV